MLLKPVWSFQCHRPAPAPAGVFAAIQQFPSTLRPPTHRPTEPTGESHILTFCDRPSVNSNSSSGNWGIFVIRGLIPATCCTSVVPGPQCYTCCGSDIHLVREGSKKNPEKLWSLIEPPSDSPRGGSVFFGHFSGENFFLHFLMENGSIVPETDFK